MKISKTLFFAAAASLLAGTFFAPEAGAVVYIGTSSSLDNSPYDSIRMSEYVEKNNSRDVTISSGTTGGTVIIDSLAIVKNTAYTSAHWSWYGRANRYLYQFLSDRWPDLDLQAGRSGFLILVDDSVVSVGAGTTGFDAGKIVIENDKVLELTGFINTWIDYGGGDGTEYNGTALTGYMDGAQTITLEGNARLDVSYTSLSQYGSHIQSLHNLYSTTSGGQLSTRDSLAGASNYFVNIYIDDYDGTDNTLEHGGSIGNIEGSANIIKSGAGSFTLLGNNVSYGRGDTSGTGDPTTVGTDIANIYVTGGSLILASGEYYGSNTSYDPNNVLKKYCATAGLDYCFGIAAAGASSVNLAGTAGSLYATANEGSLLATYYSARSDHGTFTDSDGVSHTYDSYEGTLLETPSESSLVVTNNQVICNLQAMFANASGATDTTKSISSAIANAASKATIPVVTGTGKGSVIGIASDATLAIYQEPDSGGIYKGSIAGVSQDADGNYVADLSATGGSIIKYGKGDLVLQLQTANFESLAILEGRLIANVATLNAGFEGVGNVYVADGVKLIIVENQAATLLKALSIKEGADIEFKRFAYITTRGGLIDCSSGNRSAGTIEMGVQQNIYGNLIIRDGVEVKLTADDALVNAESVVIVGDIANSTDLSSVVNEVSAWAVLSFGGTNQVVNNLVGDKWARVETGTSSRIYLNIDAPVYDESGVLLSGAYESTDNTVNLASVNNGLYGTFFGEFTGWGNIIKTGEGTLKLSGNSTNFGSVIVAEGDLAGTASTFTNASALILGKDTTATFVGNQFFSTLYGAKDILLNLSETAEAEDGTLGATTYYRLTIGESVSRQNELNDVETLPSTVFLSNSDRTIYANAREISTAIKPLLDLVDSIGTASDTYSALVNFANGDTLSGDEMALVQDLFGNTSLTRFNDLTEGNVANAYLKLVGEKATYSTEYKITTATTREEVLAVLAVQIDEKTAELAAATSAVDRKDINAELAELQTVSSYVAGTLGTVSAANQAVLEKYFGVEYSELSSMKESSLAGAYVSNLVGDDLQTAYVVLNKYADTETRVEAAKYLLGAIDNEMSENNRKISRLLAEVDEHIAENNRELLTATSEAEISKLEALNAELKTIAELISGTIDSIDGEVSDDNKSILTRFEKFQAANAELQTVVDFISGTIEEATEENAAIIATYFGDCTLSSNLTEVDLANAFIAFKDSIDEEVEYDFVESDVVVAGTKYGNNIVIGVDDATFEGDVVAGSIYKQDSSKQALLGKIKTAAITVAAGTLEIAGDSLSALDDSGDPITILVNEGATLSIVASQTLSEDTIEISGKGELEVSSDVDINLNEQFVSTTTGTISLVSTADEDESPVNFTMTIRNATSVLAAQGDISVEGNANLVLLQNGSAVSWANTLTVSGDLVKTGSADLTLTSDDSSVAGTAWVRGGTLTLIDWTKDGEATIGGIKIDVGATMTYELSAGQTANFTGAIVSDGVLNKTGTGTLILDSDAENSDFSGAFVVRAGTVSVVAADAFAETLSLNILEGAFVDLSADQSLASFTGAGTLDLGEDVTLTLKIDSDESKITVDSVVGDNGVANYVANIPTEDFIGNFSGMLTGEDGALLTIDGNGAYAFGSYASLSTDVEFYVKSGQLVLTAEQADRDVTDLTVNASSGELVYSIAAGATSSIKNNNNQIFNIGKIGAGTLTLTATQISNTEINIYEGTISIASSTNPFIFKNVTIAQGAELQIKFSGSDSSTVDLTRVEGSGRLVFVNTGTPLPLVLGGSSVLPTQPTAGTDGRYFNGVIEFQKMNIVVNSSATLSALTLDTDSSLSVIGNATLSFVQSADTEIACATSVEQGSKIAISSNKDEDGNFYKLSFAGGVTGTIEVNNGAVQVNVGETLTEGQNVGKIVAKNDADVYFYVDADDTGISKMSNLTIDATNIGSKGHLRLIKTGAGDMSLDCSEPEADVIGTINWATTTTRAITTTTTVANRPLSIGVNQGSLTLYNVDQLASDIDLVTLAAGTLVLDGSQTLDRNISGDGNVKKTDNGVLTITSNQDFTGTFTLVEGTTRAQDNPSFATSQLVIGEEATLEGSVNLTNASSTSILNLQGRLVLTADSVISYAGTLDTNDITGRIRISGTLSQGQEKVIFQSTGTQEAFTVAEQKAIADKITYSGKFMLSQDSAGTISMYAIDSEFSTTDLHEGLSGFASALSSILEDALPKGDYVIEDELASNPVAVTIFKSSESALDSIMTKASPLMYSAMTTMLWANHNNDIAQLRDRATARRFELVNEFANHGWQAWANARGTFVENSAGSDTPVYDYNIFGLLAGADKKINDYTMAGIALGYDFGKADVHSNGGRIESNDLRLTVYGSSLLGDGSWFADYGVTASVADFDIKHRSIFGEATDDTNSFSLGAFGVIGRGFLLMVDKEERVVLTPYVGLSAYYSMVNSVSESGSSANLEVDKIKALSLRGTIGASLDWVFLLADYEARVSVEAAYSHEFGDDDIDIDASIRGYSFSCSAAGTASDTFSIGPTMSMGIGPNTTIRGSYRAEFGTNEEISHNVNVGVRHNF